jgi:hypothetical protein
MSSDRNGASLIILIVAITLVSFLGFGIASFMGAKQKSLVPQAQSYQAYAIAQAGIEFGIRYAYDNKDDPDFPSPPIPQEGKAISFGGGTFTISYNTTADVLTSAGVYQTATRTIELRRFRCYYDPAATGCY